MAHWCAPKTITTLSTDPLLLSVTERVSFLPSTTKGLIMTSQPNTSRDEECSFDIAETIALCGLIPIGWLLIAMCVH